MPGTAVPPDPYASQAPVHATPPPDPYAQVPNAPPDPYANATPQPANNKYSFQQLKDLWVKAGGDPKRADIMAHVALAEAGDGKTYAYADANSDGKTSYTEGGKTYRPHGLWQISDVHGNENWNDPLTNAKKAVELFNAQQFGPWEASRSGGAGGGWGQYLNEHTDPAPANTPLPPGGFAQVIGATSYAPTKAKLQATHDQTSDTMIDRIKTLIKFQVDPVGSALSAANDAAQKILPAPVKERLSPALRRIGELGDAFTYAPMNAAAHDLNGDHAHGLSAFWSALNENAPQSVGEAMRRSLNPLAPLTDEQFGKVLDDVGSNFDFNAPSDVLYWQNQPGVHDRLASAKPSDWEGMALQLALGMHADLARLKPQHPYVTGIETGVAETVNPSYLVAGELGGMLSRSVMEGLQAARAGTFGPATQKLAHLAADAPLIGNRFTKMGDAFGMEGESWHSNLARDIQNAPYDAQDLFTSNDTFGGVPNDEQVNIVHDLQTGNPSNPKVFGSNSIAQRATNVGNIIQHTDNALRAIDPEMAAKLMSADYFPQGGAWQLDSSTPADPRFPAGTPSAGARGSGGAANVIQSGRIHETLAAGQAAGLQIDPDWSAAGAGASHQAKVQRYVVLAKAMKQLESMRTANGTPGSFDIEYLWPLPNKAFRSLGTGRRGLMVAEKLATAHAEQRSMAEATQRGVAGGWSQADIEAWAKSHQQHYRDVAMDDMRKIFRSRYPGHDFDAANSLGMPMLRGKAVENAAVAAAIDAHPQLSRIQSGDTADRFAVHTQPDQPDNVGIAVLDNLNSIARQAILSNVGYHPAFNLAPLALNEGVSPVWIARALAIDPKGTMIPKAWLDRAAQYRANAPKFGTGLSLNPNVRAKLLTVPYKGLTLIEMMQKAFISASKWNQDITFGYFEDRIAAVTMKHFEDKGMSPEAAARETRKTLGDYENMTASERAAGMRNWHYFYTWMRGQLRYWAGKAITKPQTIMAPLRGVQTANEQQGDEGSVAGGALSLRSALNTLHYGWGTDANGNPRYVSLPFPQFRYGSDVARIGGSLASGDPNDAAAVVTKMATTSLPPLAGIALGIGATAILPAGVPQPYDLRLWDKDAPTPAAKWSQFGEKIGSQYEPSIERGPREAIMNHDPLQAASALGPNLYSSPNAGPQSKLINAMSDDLRSVLKKANDAGDESLANDIYDLLQRVTDGDPLAAQQAKRALQAYKKELGIRPKPRFK